MYPSAPEPDKEIILPKTCYFTDGKSKVDYVLVIPKLEAHIKTDISEQQIDQFVALIKSKGLLIEKEIGKFHNTLIFIKIHGPHKILTRYANIYNIGLTCQNPYYKYKEKILFKWLTTELTKPNSESDIYKRAEKTLSGQRPAEITTSERSKIVYEILKRITFTFDDNEITLKTMLDREIFLQGYPIHDGDFDWTTEGPLTDRQLLYKFWANFKYIFREQPIHLIEKYYGSKIAFYFAFVSLYTKMLLIPTVIGTTATIAGLILLHTEDNYLDQEVCQSKIILCSDQKLQSACNSMKISYVIDNPVTIVYVILCSFWGAVFWNLWQRRQAMLSLRWNLMSIKAERTMRREFRENAETRKSSITGEIEYYVPPFKQFLSSVFSYFVVIILVIAFFLIVYLVVEYRFMLRKYMDYDSMNFANEIEMFSASILTTTIIMLINKCFGVILKMYAKIIHFLTMLRMPRTQHQYNAMYLHMMFFITFTNHFSPLFYLAFIKGFFHKYPGDTSEVAIIKRLQADLCHPAGCLVDLGMQLVVLMVIKNFTKYSSELFKHLTAPWKKYTIPKETQRFCGQWEKDFALAELDESVINELYADLVLQYSFITFFNASLPIVGLIAFIHSSFKIQNDAFRFLTLYKRPLIERVPDIEGWNNVVKVLSVVGCVSNTFLVAFRTNFIHRVLYKSAHNGSLEGYINSTLSKFAIADIQHEDMIIEHQNESFCFYRGFRYPPEHQKKYQPTEEYWHHMAIKAVYFIVLEKFTLLLSITLSYLIPKIPRKVKVKLEHDEKLLREARENRMEDAKVEKQ